MYKTETKEAPAPQVDWVRWMRGLGRHKRRVREFLGLSQEQLARLAGVSQGAISRLEAGRGLATPLLVVMKINAAFRRAFDQLDPALLSEEARRLRESDDVLVTESKGGFEQIALLRDPELEELVRLYNDLPGRQRQKVLALVRATIGAMAGS